MTGSIAQLRRLPWRKRLHWTILLFTLFTGIGMALIGAIGGAALGEILHFDKDGCMFLAMLGQTLFALPVLFGLPALWPPLGKLQAKLGIRPLKWTDIWLALLIFFLSIVIGSGLTESWQEILKWLKVDFQEKQEVLLSVANTSFPELICYYITIAVLVPIGEEILFRRVLFGLFRPLGLWAGILLTSLVFSLVHFFLLGIPTLFVMGIGFQLAYLLRRNLATAMLTHGLVNFTALTVNFLAGD